MKRNEQPNGHAARNGKASAMLARPAPTPATPAPAEGDRTMRQVKSMSVGGELLSILGFRSSENIAGDGDYEKYREMVAHPAIALAQAVTSAPIRAAGWSIDSDDDASDEAIGLVTDVFDPCRGSLLQQAVRSIYYGFQTFEKVWVRDGSYLAIDRFKPLLPDLTKILIDPHGSMLGVKNGEVVLDRGKCMVISHDVEADNWYGRSRLENIRKWAWAPWCTSAKKLETYQSKTAGVIPIIRYPEGQGVNAAGQTINNAYTAQQSLINLGKSIGIYVPSRLEAWAEDAVRAGATIESLMQWQVTFLEAKAGHGAEFLSALGYYDKCIMRGYLVPERTVLEGQFGTKAEAGVHGDIAALITQGVLDEIVEQINRQAVDDVLLTNFGPDMVGKVYLRSEPIIDEAKDLFRTILTAMYAAAPDLARVELDIPAMEDRLQLPRAQEGNVVADPLAPVVPPGPPAGGAGTPTTTTPPADSIAASLAATLAKGNPPPARVGRRPRRGGPSVGA